MASRRYLNLYQNRLKSLNQNNDNESEAETESEVETEPEAGSESESNATVSGSEDALLPNESRNPQTSDKEMDEEDLENSEKNYEDNEMETDEIENKEDLFDSKDEVEVNVDYPPPNGDSDTNDSLVLSIHKGDYDEVLISAIRCNHFDLRQLSSGVSYKHANSIFHRLAKHCGLPDDDDAVAFMLYRILIYNLRGIRDRLDQCECCRGSKHYFAKLVPIDDNHDLLSEHANTRRVKKVSVGVPKHMNIKPPQTKASSVETLAPPSSQSQSLPPALPPSQSPPQPHTEPPPALPPAKPVEEPQVKSDSSMISIPSDPPTEESEKSGFNITADQQNQMKKGQKIEIKCPRCGFKGKTEVQYKMGAMTIATALAMAAVCLIPCLCIPLVSNCTKDEMHICPKCAFIVGTLRKGPCGKKFESNWKEGEAKMPKRFQNSKLVQRMSLNVGALDAKEITSRLSVVMLLSSDDDEETGESEVTTGEGESEVTTGEGESSELKGELVPSAEASGDLNKQ